MVQRASRCRSVPYRLECGVMELVGFFHMFPDENGPVGFRLLSESERAQFTPPDHWHICRHCREPVECGVSESECEKSSPFDGYCGDCSCPGHYNDDVTLLSGVAIGEPSFCNGSCVRR